MSGRLQVAGISAPGFLGLNSQESEVNLESGYATQATNCIIDKFGRLGSRKGWQVVTTDSSTLAANELTTIFEFKDTTGTITYLSAGNGKLFTGLDVLVEKKLRNTANSADITLVSAIDNWQVASLNFGLGAGAETQAFFAQRGTPLIVWNLPASDYIFQRVGDVGAVPTGLTTATFDPNIVLSAFGRLWCADLTQDRHTIYYSRLLEGDDFAGAGAGILDIASVVGNSDEIVALSSHNGFLVIFCKNNILIYANAQDPANITLSDTITGVGCVARDSVQKTGTDLIYLSKSGVRSFARTVQEKSMPMRELSLNIRDNITDSLNNEILANIKSAYFEREAFYLLSFPATDLVYCFDTRSALPNGASRVTTWTDMNFKAYVASEERELYLATFGGIARYRGFSDNTASYRMVYFTTSTDSGAASTLKFLKKAAVTVIGNETQDFVIKYGFDYSTRFIPRTTTGNQTTVPSNFNVAEYNIGEYSGGLVVSEIRVNLGGSGRVIKFGVESEVNGAPVSIQKAEVFFKLGKLL